jgi:hypothetical protein
MWFLQIFPSSNSRIDSEQFWLKIRTPGLPSFIIQTLNTSKLSGRVDKGG